MVSLTWPRSAVCFILAIINIILTTATTIIHAIPITPPTPSQTQPFPLTLNLSNHLLFDHVEPLVYQSSQYIATTFRTSMTLQCIPNDDDQIRLVDQAIPVDLDLLLGQLQGAVGSFLEDKLPGIWNRHLVHVDRTMIQTRLETTSSCPDLTCLEHAFDQTERYLIEHELDTAWRIILHGELPLLFQAAKSQVHGVLALFDAPPHHRYQLTWHLDEMVKRLMDHWIILITTRPTHSHLI